GVAVEAVTAGIPVIYTEDTWIADLVGTVGAGASIKDGNVDSLVAALSHVYDERDHFRSRAQEAKRAARAAHSGASFTAALWTAGNGSDASRMHIPLSSSVAR